MLSRTLFSSQKNGRTSDGPRRGRRSLKLESLERRTLLSATPTNPCVDWDPDCFTPEAVETSTVDYGQVFDDMIPLGENDYYAMEYSSESETMRDAHTSITQFDFSMIFYSFMNNDPTADPGGPYSIAEGDPITLDASGSEDLDGDTLTFTWDVNGDGLFDDATGENPTLDAVQLAELGIEDDGTWTVTAQVNDDFGGISEATTELTVENVAPEAAIGDIPEAADEGSPIVLSSSVIDPGTADTHALAWNVAKDGEAYAAADGESFAFTPDDNGVYDVTLAVTDDDGGTSETSASIDVANVAPELGGVNTPELVGDGDALALSGEIADPGTADTFALNVDWGDGTSDTFGYESGTASFEESHVYDEGGIYAIDLTLSDDDGGEAVDVASTMVTGVGVHDGVLEVIGSNADDHAFVGELDDGRFVVTGDFTDTPWTPEVIDPADIERIDMRLLDGDDVGLIANNVTTPAMIQGGAGNDQLIGGRADDVIVGGEGSDVLVGGRGRDIMVGGQGGDLLVGNMSDDLLVAGTTSHDANDEALLGMSAEWSSERDFDTRVANLRGVGESERLNGDFFLTTGDATTEATVFDDGVRDVLLGGLAQDWFLAQTSAEDAAARDTILGQELEDLFDMLG